MKTPAVRIKERLVTDVEPVKGGFLIVSWDNGSTGLVDLRAMIATMPVFAFLRDPDAFGAVQLLEDGAAIGWTDYDGDVIDIDADTLWLRRRPLSKVPAKEKPDFQAAE